MTDTTPEVAAHSDEGLAGVRVRADLPAVVQCEAPALAQVLVPEPVYARVGGRDDAVLASALRPAAVDVLGAGHSNEKARAMELA